MTVRALQAPFPWFGGKSLAASEIWRALGNVPNYVEPFAGSLAVLLNRPGDPVTETINDLDGFVANAWRAIQADPEAVARWVDWPVSEVDLTARHLWLLDRRAALTSALQADPDYFDAKIAGWWIWGLCSWIGTGWCSGDGPWVRADPDDPEQGLVKAESGIRRKLPHLSNAGQGVHRQLSDLSYGGKGIYRTGPGLAEWFADLSARLRRVRVACGDWRRVLGDSMTWRHGVTGIVLDPPYPEGNMEYAVGGSVFADVAEWAAENGDRPDLRIVLCGYEGTWTLPPGWTTAEWTPRNGYNKTGDNVKRERLWCSPACLTSQPSLF